MIINSVHAQEIQAGEQKSSEKLSDLALQQKVEAALIDKLGVDFRQLEVCVERGVVNSKGDWGPTSKMRIWRG